MPTAQIERVTMGHQSAKRGPGRPPREPHGPLEKWFKKSGMSYAEAAQRLSVDEATLRQIAQGTKQADGKRARSIHMLTGKAVSTDDIIDYYETRKQHLREDAASESTPAED